MAPFALLFGGLMVAVGLIGFLAPTTFGEVGAKGTSTTALIPAYLGGGLILCGLITLAKPTLRKHTMHLAALIGVIGFAGGFMPLVRSNFDFKMASAVSGILMTGLSLMFVILCVRSFIAARKARSAP
jgi:hypothetical protein